MSRKYYCCLFILTLICAPVLAHHSHAGYNPDERFTLQGTITDVFWGNPHILFTVNDGKKDVRIEWITTTGAVVTNVSEQQLNKGDTITVIGSRNPDPSIHTMALVKELLMPDSQWHWISPSIKGKNR